MLALIATTPQDLCTLAQVSKVLHGVMSDDGMWKEVFLKYRKYEYNKKEGVSYKAATLGINHARFPLEHLFSRIYALQSKIERVSFQEGVDPSLIKSLEESHNISLPLYIREYFMIANGQQVLPYSKGFIGGMRLLSLEEALEGMDIRQQEGKFLTDTCSSPQTSPIKHSIGLPLTTVQGYTQILASEKTGQIYLESGWNVFNKAANWYHFLFDFMSSQVSILYL